ncbi:hypothetical protein HII36_50845 [Nonomuraea sp. NN258]|uniref:WD40 repeat domain-containing protein n=1 Tax=Nonomuraea antri TaxID=2730852 RepID=UPI00156A67D1|nr:hypothetical protein [Nonomuraea antri]NRQ40070.1 hypothetical protein [Nonomuraea antri]
MAVAVGELNGRPVAVSAGSSDDDPAVRVWDLATHQPIGEPILAHPHGVTALAVGRVDGRSVVVTGGYDSLLRVWGLATHEPIGEPIRLSDDVERVEALAIGEVDGRAVVVAAGGWGNARDGALVRVWDLATHKPSGEPLVGHTGMVRDIALGEVDGRSVAVTGSIDHTTRMWDMTTRKPIGDPMISGTAAWDVALGRVDGRPVAVSGTDEKMWVWDLTTDQRIGVPIPTGHTGAVGAVAFAEVYGRPVALTGGSDDEDRGGTLQAWDLNTRKPLGGRMGHTGFVLTIALGEVDGRLAAVTGDSYGDVRVWDLGAHPQ